MDDMYLNIFTNAMGNIISQIVMIIAMIAVEKMKQTKKNNRMS